MNIVTPPHFEMIDNQEYILAQKLIESDKGAFKEIYISFYNAVYYFISRYIDQQDVVKDLTQEAFFLLWQHRERLNPALGYKSYILSIAKNRVLNYLRSCSYHQKYKDATAKKSLQQQKENIIEDNIFNKIENHNLLNIVYEEINKLPQKQKDVVIMSKMKYHTNKEIAQELGISIKTVEYRLMCALRKIRKIIES